MSCRKRRRSGWALAADPSLGQGGAGTVEPYALMAAKIERRFAVVLCADVVGYSRLMGIDEEGTLAGVNAVWREVVDPKILECNGRTVRTMGDGLLVESGRVCD